MLQVMETFVGTVTRLLMPAESDALYDACMEQGEMTRFITAMLEVYPACKRGSLESRWLRALMEFCSYDTRIAHLVRECGTYEDENIGNNIHVTMTCNLEKGHLVRNLTTAMGPSACLRVRKFHILRKVKRRRLRRLPRTMETIYHVRSGGKEVEACDQCWFQDGPTGRR